MIRMDSIELEISSPKRKYLMTTKFAGLLGLAGAKNLLTNTVMAVVLIDSLACLC